MIKKIILWILVLSCAGAIFFFSSQEATDSDRVSSGLIIMVVKLFDFTDSLSENQVIEIATRLNSVVRVCAHFTIFALFGAFIALLLKEYGFMGRRLVFYSALISFLYSCTDELHQSFVPGRSAQLSDIITDSLGAAFGIMVIWLLTNKVFVRRTAK